jgi:Co/Zn/Cd efflux system component
MRIDWRKGERANGSIDLLAALADLLTKIEPGVIITPVEMEDIKRYLRNVETIQPIASRQVAALALANALQLVRASWVIVERKDAPQADIERSSAVIPAAVDEPKGKP